MQPDIKKYNEQQQPEHRAVCDLLADEITKGLTGAEQKIWHAHPVWFVNGNPIVGYSKQKADIRLMFNLASVADQLGDSGLDPDERRDE